MLVRGAVENDAPLLLETQIGKEIGFTLRFAVKPWPNVGTGRVVRSRSLSAFGPDAWSGQIGGACEVAGNVVNIEAAGRSNNTLKRPADDIGEAADGRSAKHPCITPRTLTQPAQWSDPIHLESDSEAEAIGPMARVRGATKITPFFAWGVR